MPLARRLPLVPVLLWLGGCAMGPVPFGGAPVEDRRVQAAPPPVVPTSPPPPRVQVQPLPRPEPIVARQGSLEPVVPYTPPPQQPAAPARTDAPPPQPPSQPAQISGQGNEAVVALLDSAAGYVGSGELEKAAAALERALRIEPRNASIWYDLAQIRLHQGQYQQAESMATKSNSLAGDDRGLRERNWKLIALARRAMGNQAGADAAEAQASIQRRGGG